MPAAPPAGPLPDEQGDLPAHPGYDYAASVWGQLGERFGLVSLRPKLDPEVRIEAFQPSTMAPRDSAAGAGRDEGEPMPEAVLLHRLDGRMVPLSSEDLRIVQTFDGKKSIAEIVAAQLREGGKLQIDPVLDLVDRVMRAGLLAGAPPNVYRQLEAHIAVSAVDMVQRFRRRAAVVEVLGAAALEGDGDGEDEGEGGAGAGGEPGARHERAGGEGSAAGADGDGDEGEGEGRFQMYEQVPWRPRTPALAERARFLRGIELLRSLDSWAIGTLAEAATEETVPALSNVVSEGAVADQFFIVRSGELNVTRQNADGSLTRIARLGAGEWFGEIGMLEGASRNASVRVGAARPAQLYAFDANTFERIISPHITSFRGRQLLARRRSKLEGIGLFAELAPADLERLAQAIKEHHLPARTAVFQQGEVGDRFYVIVEGSVGVVKDGVPVAKLIAGDFFGETALLFSPERTASVLTIDDTVLWSIDQASFRELIRGHLLHRRDLMPTLMNRLHG